MQKKKRKKVAQSKHNVWMWQLWANIRTAVDYYLSWFVYLALLRNREAPEKLFLRNDNNRNEPNENIVK